MLSFQEYILEDEEYSHIENHPKGKMRSYTEQEFPWEYREYTQYAHGQFPRPEAYSISLHLLRVFGGSQKCCGMN